MRGYKNNIEKLTLANTNFRQVLYTGKHSQLVLMSLKPLEEIGLEIHLDSDQFFRFESGLGHLVIDNVEQVIGEGDAVIVPAGAEHNIINTSATEPLKLYTIYSPAHHRDGVTQATKEEAMADDEEFDNQTTE